MDDDSGQAEVRPIVPATSPLMNAADQDATYAAAGGGGFLALALVRGLRTPGWTRTVAIVLVTLLVLGLVAVVLGVLV